MKTLKTLGMFIAIGTLAVSPLCGFVLVAKMSVLLATVVTIGNIGLSINLINQIVK